MLVINLKKEIKKDDNSISIGEILKRNFTDTSTLVIMLFFTVVAVSIPLILFESEQYAYIAFFLFLTLVIGSLITIYKDLNGRIEKDRYVVLLLSFIIVIVFWGAFEQAGGLMNLYAQNKTDRMLMGIEIPAAVFQFFNPFFILILAVPIANFWIWWRHRGKETSSLFKMANGVIIMGLGFIFMVFASMQYEALGKSAMYWLVLAYLLHTVGELCASPVVLSFVTKLAPAKYGALMMGVYFASTGLGNKIAGIIGESAENAGELNVFLGITITCVIFGILVNFILKPLKRLTHGAEDSEHDIHDETEGFELADNQ